jgi:hypothetical protein
MSSLASSTFSLDTSTTTTIMTTITTTSFSNTTKYYPIDPKCTEIYKNSSSGVYIAQFEGIPENLLLNVVVWLVLLIVYTLVRTIGDYGRFGLIKSDEEKHLLDTKAKRYSIWTSKFFSPITRDNSINLSRSRRRDEANDSILNYSTTSLASNEITASADYKDDHFFSWIINLIKLNDISWSSCL